MTPIFLFTDFTHNGPYVGQLHARIAADADAIRVIDLMHDAPRARPDLAAYLLPAICRGLPKRGIVVGVVDPGVGGDRLPVVVETPALTFVGPDNGLFSRLPGIERVSIIDWRPEVLSKTFHGRDLFAPVAARLAQRQPVPLSEIGADDLVGADWPADLAAVVYIDGYGNAMIGMDAEKAERIQALRVHSEVVRPAGRFGEVPPGEPFWYPNSQGLIEIAVNQGSAADRLSLALGDKILLH